MSEFDLLWYSTLDSQIGIEFLKYDKRKLELPHANDCRCRAHLRIT